MIGRAAALTLLGCGLLAPACRPGPTTSSALDRPRFQAEKVDPKVYDSMNEFSFKLARAANLAGGNSCLSPVSLDQTLVVLLNGAEGKAFETLADLLDVENPDIDAINQGRMALIDELRYLPGNPVTLSTGIFSVQPLRIHPPFAGEMRTKFGAELRKLGGANTDSARQVRDWVANESLGRITEYDPELSKDLLFIVLNVATLTAEWEGPFDAPQAAQFMSPSGTKEVPTIKDHRAVGYYRDDTFSAVRIPYKDKTLSMVFALPKKGNVSGLVNSLSATKWRSLLKSFRTDSLDLQFPVFSVEATQDLVPALKALGGESLFRPGNDFRRVSREVYPPETSISRFKQTTFIEVDERGTRAAAATQTDAVAMDAPMEPLNFIADRPFFYAVVEEKTGTILFFGVVTDPSVRSGRSEAQPR
ncbi:MAG: hypothetical protein KIT11_11505 [Fimbriimonadaceae bacterium]|nr:hypothetical protein [Fimbriimonadaceae bacterium]QYK55341.1 MAG: hypothetical protein KF733_10030 [Fimbriimonadaceae bacterium]